jgi:hypothetical protein
LCLDGLGVKSFGLSDLFEFAVLRKDFEFHNDQDASNC